MLKAKDIMTKDVITIGKDTPVLDAVWLMAKNNVTGLPVVGDHTKLVGILTEKDVLRLFSTSGNVTGRTVTDFMTQPAVYFDENEDLQDVCKCLMDSFFRRLPVTSNGRVVGIISRRDFIEYILKTNYAAYTAPEPA